MEQVRKRGREWDPHLEALRTIIKHLERLRGEGA
jgi:hypothetical protein